MQKVALIFVNGMEKNLPKVVSKCSEACLQAYRKAGYFTRKKWEKDNMEKVVAQVIDIQTIMQLKYNAEKLGIKVFLLTDNMEKPDPMETVLALGPEDGERLNKISANFRLFSLNDNE